MDLVTPLVDMAEALTAAGVPASVDPAALNLPGVWVTLETVTDYTAGGGGILRAQLVLIAPDRDHRRALEQLSELYDKATEVVPPMGDTRADAITTDGNPHPVPALIYTHDLAL